MTRPTHDQYDGTGLQSGKRPAITDTGRFPTEDAAHDEQCACVGSFLAGLGLGALTLAVVLCMLAKAGV